MNLTAHKIITQKMMTSNRMMKILMKMTIYGLQRTLCCSANRRCKGRRRLKTLRPGNLSDSSRPCKPSGKRWLSETATLSMKNMLIPKDLLKKLLILMLFLFISFRGSQFQQCQHLQKCKDLNVCSQDLMSCRLKNISPRISLDF
jgi:hypothetical protein